MGRDKGLELKLWFASPQAARNDVDLPSLRAKRSNPEKKKDIDGFGLTPRNEAKKTNVIRHCERSEPIRATNISGLLRRKRLAMTKHITN